MFLHSVLSSRSPKSAFQCRRGGLIAIRPWAVALLSVVVCTAGCDSSRPTQVEETDEYSFDDITSQLAAEEAASAAEREE